MYDLVKWFQMPSVTEGNKLADGSIYGRETHHLEGVTLDGKPAEREYHVLTPKNMIFAKDPRGWPWDVKSYDDKFIYDWITELNWTSNKDYKAFNPPLTMMPRNWNGDPYSNNEIIHLSSNYDVFQNCQKRQTQQDVQEVTYNIHAPVYMDFGGDIGECRTIIFEYYWDNNDDRELGYLTTRAGWVYWQHQNFKNNNYITDQSTLHNKIVKGSLINGVQFPCQIIP